MQSIETGKMNYEQFLRFKNILVIHAKITSEYNVNFIEAFAFKGHHFLVFDDMTETGPFLDVIKRYKGDYSEDFCEYVLYNVALGIKNLH